MCPTHGGMLSEIRELKPGMVIHRTYRIVRKLGQGGMGTVYLVDHVLMEEQRALKFLSAELSQDAAFTGRFRREVRTLRQVRHKNVVDCGDLEQAEDDSLFFAMEFVNGPDLRSFLSKAPQPFDIEMALAIAEGIAEGLGAAHAQGMVHRDIKPENILMARVGDTWIPKIADFGIVATKETSNYTQTGSSLLTPFYAAPEQWRGTRAAELDGRTDLYALGGLLFLMLTGEKVFDAENYEGWAYQHQRTPPRAPSSVRVELADWRGLDALVVRLLAKEPADRPANVAEFLSLLAAVHYAPPTASRKTVRVPPVVEEEQAAPKSTKRLPVWIWAVAAVVLIAAAFGAGRIFGPQAAKPVTTPSAQAPSETSTVQTSPAQTQSSPTSASQPAGSAGEAASAPAQSKPQPVKAPSTPTPIHEKASQPAKSEQQSKPVSSNSKPPVPEPSAIDIKDQAETLYDNKKFDEAAKLYKEACARGNAASCNRLGFLYRQGDGVPKDYTRAFGLFSNACDNGSTGGCDNLGILYDNGWGVDKDSVRAAYFFNKACDGGGGNGCTNLGILTLAGRGVPKDMKKGKEFLDRGCALGDSRGCKRREMVK